MTRETLEKNQVFLYVVAILLGLMTGVVNPALGPVAEAALWPVLGALLYVTFTQIPLMHVRQAFSAPRFLMAAIAGNFAAIPLVVGALLLFAPENPAVRLGILMVLLVPCTDWFIVFTQLGRGDTSHAIAFTPISLVLQMLLLPVYLWAFLGNGLSINLAESNLLMAFATLILAPLGAAFLTEQWSERRNGNSKLLVFLAWLPVPLLAIVIFIIAVSQVNLVMAALELLGHLTLLFTAYLLAAAGLARLFARIFRLPAAQGRALAFSFGTRNSFVVLPIALALPAAFQIAVVVIVFQSLVELLGMIAYLWWVPQRLFPEA